MALAPRPLCYLDECVNVHLAELLRSRAFTTITAGEAGLLGATDEEQLAYATVHGLVIISHNGADFKRLHVRYRQEGRPHAGIVLLSQTRPVPQLVVRAAMMLDWIALIGEHRSTLFRWGALQQLLSQDYRLPGYDDADIRLALGRSP